MSATPDFRSSPAASASQHDKPIVEVAAGLVFRDGRLLLTQRYPAAHLGGLWEFPGGKREAPETFVACLQRELLEELGIEVNVLEIIEAVTHRYPEKTVLIQFYRCRWLQHEPQALGCPDFKWVTRAELGLYAFPPADARLLAILQARDDLWRTDPWS